MAETAWRAWEEMGDADLMGIEMDVKMMQMATKASKVALIRLFGRITSRSIPCAPITAWLGICSRIDAVDVIDILHRVAETASNMRDARAALAS